MEKITEINHIVYVNSTYLSQVLKLKRNMSTLDESKKKQMVNSHILFTVVVY